MRNKLRKRTGFLLIVFGVAGLSLVPRLYVSSSPADVPGDQVTHTTLPGYRERDPVGVPTSFVMSKRASSGPEFALAYLRGIGMKPLGAAAVGPWTAEDGTPVGLAIRVRVESATIPAAAPSLEPSRRSCEQEADDLRECADRFLPTAKEPYRQARGRNAQEGAASNLVVLVDQRGASDALAAVETAPTQS